MSDEASRERMEIMALARGPKGEQGVRGRRGPVRTVAYLFMVNFAVSAIMLFGLVHYVNAQNAKWCTTLNLLTAHPVPKPAHPSANPSREQAYVFYTDFRELRRSLGCG
jgi:hypothetical protein